MLAKMPEFIDAISSVPPCSDDTLAWSLPSAPPGNTLTLSLPPDLAVHQLGELLHAQHDGMALGVLVGELDGAGLRLREPKAATATAATQGLEEQSFHALSPWKCVGRGWDQP
jgi:hypothetical protein